MRELEIREVLHLLHEEVGEVDGHQERMGHENRLHEVLRDVVHQVIEGLSEVAGTHAEQDRYLDELRSVLVYHRADLSAGEAFVHQAEVDFLDVLQGSRKQVCFLSEDLYKLVAREVQSLTQYTV